MGFSVQSLAHMNYVEIPSRLGSPSIESLESRSRQRKWPISYGAVSSLALTCDALAILLIGNLSGYLYSWYAITLSDGALHYVGSSGMVAALFVCVMKAQDLYDPSELLNFKTQIIRTVATWFSVFLFLSGAAFALKVGAEFSRIAISTFALLGLVSLISQRLFYKWLLRRGLAKSKFAGRTAVLITDEISAGSETLVPTLLKHSFRLERRFVLPTNDNDHPDIESFTARIADYVRGTDIDEVILGINADRWSDLSRLLSGLRLLPLPVSLVPVGAAADILKRPTRILGDSICVELHHGPLRPFERGIKRTIDLCIAMAGLTLLIPLLLAVALIIKLDSPGPVLFRQTRCGFNGRKFRIFKFRTMSVMEDGPSICQAATNDARLTGVGAWLRRTSIDELPQLFNVLAGTMSLVGPRPHALAHDNQFAKLVGKYAFRHHVKPGLTGWAQVNGHRGPTPTADDVQRRVELDLWYIDNWSLRLDISIIARTFIEVFRGRNAY